MSNSDFVNFSTNFIETIRKFQDSYTEISPPGYYLPLGPGMCLFELLANELFRIHNLLSELTDVKIISVAGSPIGNVVAPKGSLAVDYVNARTYQNVDGATTWTELAIVQSAAESVFSLCDASVVVGDLVYLNTAQNRMEKALATTISTLPAIGFVMNKSDATHAEIATDGNVTVLTDDAGAALVSGYIYFVSTTVAGKITRIAPTASGHFIQKVGSALNQTTVLVNLDSDLVMM